MPEAWPGLLAASFRAGPQDGQVLRGGVSSHEAPSFILVLCPVLRSCPSGRGGPLKPQVINLLSQLLPLLRFHPQLQGGLPLEK